MGDRGESGMLLPAAAVKVEVESRGAGLFIELARERVDWFERGWGCVEEEEGLGKRLEVGERTEGRGGFVGEVSGQLG